MGKTERTILRTKKGEIMMLSKEERKARKNYIKQHLLLCLFENLEGNKVLYNQETGNWDISLQVGFELPEGMEKVEKGFEEDVKREGLKTYLAQQKEQLSLKLKEYFGVISESQEDDYNLTYIFPPGFIAIADGKTYRLKTKEEIQRIAEQAPSLVEMMNREFELLEQGVYEFIPDTPIEEYDIYAFRLKKYSSLRARFHFSIPNQKIKELNPESVEPIFAERKSLAS
jgi:dsDNA-binding SOS-regulon protein